MLSQPPRRWHYRYVPLYPTKTSILTWGTYYSVGESLTSSLVGGCNIKGEDDSWDFGTGAGFYVNATEDPWKTNYRMYSYVTEEVI